MPPRDQQSRNGPGITNLAWPAAASGCSLSGLLLLLGVPGQPLCFLSSAVFVKLLEKKSSTDPKAQPETLLPEPAQQA